METDPPGFFEFNVDGELIGCGPADFYVIPRALKVIVGPGYAPDPFGKAPPRSERLPGLDPRGNRK